MPEEQKTSLWKNKTALIFALEQIPFFDELTESEMAKLINVMSLYELDPGEILFREGDEGQYVCFVVEGVLEILKKSITGHEIVITTLSHGYSIGEMSMFDRTPRSATVRARDKVTLAVLPQNGFKMILKKFPAIGIKILIGFARFQTENLRKTSNRLNAYTHLLATIASQSRKGKSADLSQFLKADEISRIQETHSISSLNSSGQILKKIKRLFST